MSSTMQRFEGNLHDVGDARFGIVASRFNHFIVDRLVDGAVDALVRHGVASERIDLAYVPGAFELPLVVDRLARSKKYDAIIACSAVIRGSTPHFDYVAGEATKGTAQSMLQTGLPIAFAVLTTDTIEQAIERAGTKAGNKGFEAGMTALEMVSLMRSLTAAGI